jgi:predicted metalloendopeptidase
VLSQSGLGLPDRDYYFDADKAEKRAKYSEYVQTMLGLLGAAGVAAYTDPAACASAAAAVVAFEMALAEAHLTRTAARDPELTYNKMSIQQLVDATQPALTWPAYLSGTTGATSQPKLDWVRYFELIGKAPAVMGDVNVAMVAAMKRAAELAANSGGLAAALPHYLSFHVANSYAPHLSAAFVDAHFAFHEKELKGTTEIRPR